MGFISDTVNKVKNKVVEWEPESKWLKGVDTFVDTMLTGKDYTPPKTNTAQSTSSPRPQRATTGLTTTQTSTKTDTSAQTMATGDKIRDFLRENNIQNIIDFSAKMKSTKPKNPLFPGVYERLKENYGIELPLNNTQKENKGFTTSEGFKPGVNAYQNADFYMPEGFQNGKLVFGDNKVTSVKDINTVAWWNPPDSMSGKPAYSNNSVSASVTRQPGYSDPVLSLLGLEHLAKTPSDPEWWGLENNGVGSTKQMGSSTSFGQTVPARTKKGDPVLSLLGLEHLAKTPSDPEWWGLENNSAGSTRQWGDNASLRQPLPVAKKEEKKDKTLDTLSNILTALSVVPALDTFTNLASIPVDIAKGDWLSAGLDLFGAIPFVGEVADTAKLGLKAGKVLDKASDGAKVFDNIADGAKVFDNTADAVKVPKSNRLNSKADPMAEVYGAGEVSNPVEVKQYRNELKDAGVRLVEREEEALGYAPALISGEPGTVYISKGASYSAWMHEMQHMRDDQAAGWLGMRVIKDPDKRYAWEIKAYNIEIEMAKKAGREDIVERLIENLEKERREIYGK